MKTPILILGATSSIGRATALCLAAQGYPLFLAGRNEEELERIAADIRIRYGVVVKVGFFDALAYESHALFFQRVIAEMRDLEGVLLAFGSLGDATKAATNFAAAKELIDVNYSAACSILIQVADYFSVKKKGFIIAISSIAGDRGRQSNYVYGSTKAALSTFLEGLRNRLHPLGVRVITIKPGFVDTPMTYGKPGMFLVATPQEVAEGIVRALHGSADVVYLPRFWRLVAWTMKFIPECLFKRLKL